MVMVALALLAPLIAFMVLLAPAGPSDVRICPGSTVTGTLTDPDSQATYRLYVPARATVHIAGAADVLERDTTGGWQTGLGIDIGSDLVVNALLGSYYDGPYYNQAFAGDWTQGDATGTVTLRVHQVYGTHVRYRFTTTLIGASGSDPSCTLRSPTAAPTSPRTSSPAPAVSAQGSDPGGMSTPAKVALGVAGAVAVAGLVYLGFRYLGPRAATVGPQLGTAAKAGDELRKNFGALNRALRTPEEVAEYASRQPVRLNFDRMFLTEELNVAQKLGVKPLQVGQRGFDAIIRQGIVRWGITPDGKLSFVPATVNKQEIAYSAIAGGRDLIAAGTAKITEFSGRYACEEIWQYRGHYQASHVPLEIAKQVFQVYGIGFT
jgi:hypothetical protein